MTREKMTEMLSETICVTMEEARDALEAREWNVLDAARLLQLERARAERAEAERNRTERRAERRGLRRIGSALRGMIARADRVEACGGDVALL